jgi:hypothetical protein
MISILVVTQAGKEEEIPLAPHPSVEVLHARGLEDTLEKLGRNRRVDAVLLAAGCETSEIAEAVLEDNPAPPPLFTAEPGAPPGVRLLVEPVASRLLERVVEQLEG